ncbi:FUSC family protein [Kineococcus sp. SYSU DK003]|uniref:FUSC family protein n=1 Tax=Kineococcus sp. SYSU DK003 TaxID=3383124 RepID=UPI003D7D3415
MHQFLTDLLRVAPAPGAWRVAVRASCCLLLALLALWWLEHLAWALYATFGVFASVYGGRAPVPGRWRTQGAVGILLVAAVATGAAVAVSVDRTLLVVPVAAAWAAGTSLLADRGRWRPPGPMFFVFAVTACGSVPVAASDVGPVTGVAAGAAALSVLLGVLEVRLAPSRAAAPPPPHVPREVPLLAHALCCAVVVAAAGGVAVALGIGHPYWAMVAAVVPLAAPTSSTQVVRGVQRSLGTVVGVLVAAVLLAPPLPALAVVVLLAVLQGATELVVTRNYGLAMLFITPLALLSGQLALTRPVATLVADRVLETLVGVVVGLLGALVFRALVARRAGRGNLREGAVTGDEGP